MESEDGLREEEEEEEGRDARVELSTGLLPGTIGGIGVIVYSTWESDSMASGLRVFSLVRDSLRENSVQRSSMLAMGSTPYMLLLPLLLLAQPLLLLVPFLPCPCVSV